MCKLVSGGGIALTQGLLRTGVQSVILAGSIFTRACQGNGPDKIEPSVFKVTSVVSFILLGGGCFCRGKRPRIIGLFGAASKMSNLYVQNGGLGMRRGGNRAIVMANSLLGRAGRVSMRRGRVEAVCWLVYASVWVVRPWDSFSGL